MYYHYGDWVPPPPHPQVNQSLTSAVAYAGDVLSLSKLAGALKKNEDQQKYAALYGQIGQKFHAAFYNPAVKGYADGGQSANVLALSIDAVPATLKTEVVNSLLSNIEQNTYHLTTGILGAKALFPILSQLGHHDVALKIMTQVTYPSYGYMFNNPYENATTLWELMDAPFEGPGMNSRNHIMWGSVGAWFYRFIAGIKPNALEEIEISPAPVGPNSPVNSVQATYDSLKGVIGVNWKKTADSFFMDVSVPSGTKGRVVIPHHESPYSVLLRDGQELAQFKGQELQVSQSEGINSFRLYEDGSIELKVQPGFYRFKAVV
jgi:alpha-L-rhamnosidase